MILHAEFAAQAKRTPDAVAIVDHGASITYAQLNEHADRVAACLVQRGVRDGFIGVHAERSIDYVVAMLGVLKAGCAVVPLPPSLPARRLRQVVDAADLAAIVDVAATPFGVGEGRVVHLGDALKMPPEPSAVLPDVAVRPSFVLSTSGSTGRPKLIVRSHRSFFHRLRWTWEQHPFGSADVCVQKSNMTTTHAIYELFEPMLRGVPVHIVSDQEVRDLPAFWTGLAERQVSRLLIVPSLLQASLDASHLPRPPLDVLVLMGERVSSTLAGRVLDAFPHTNTIVSIYGSTEASSALVCDLRASYRPGQELPLGEPISPEVRVEVLDDQLAAVPPGASGMLYLGGPELFTAYHGEPALTASSLIQRDGDLLYRTQDVVRRLPGGGLEFVGRADDVVKIRGFRVDPRDVETAISQNADVTGCVVLATTTARDASPSLVAFVTPAGVGSRDVLRAARERLPDHMVPSAVVTLAAFPLSANGKVDRRRLLDEFLTSTAVGATYVSDTERSIAEVWTTVLGHARFDRTSSFFEVGGTSLDVFAVEQRLIDALSLDAVALSPMTFYRHPTIEDLAAYVDGVRSGGRPAESGAETILVTLKRANNPALPPLFLISSAGGALGAYSKLARALSGEREIIGVRDPFLWGARDPSRGFSAWVTDYVDAIRERQSEGPYYLAAYSSAGAFGFEIGRRLRSMGHEVRVLALIDPLALDRSSKRRFGHWALQARFDRPIVAAAIRAVGRLRPLMPRSRLNAVVAQEWTPSSEEFERFAVATRRDRAHLRRVSALLELNTGLPLALSEEDLAGADAEDKPLLDRLRRVSPDVDLDMMRRLVVQYELQVRAHHAYQLRPYDGTVCLFEPDGPFVGLEATQLRPYVRRLRARRLALGPDVSAPSAIHAAFPAPILTHYLCMRDGTFVTHLARELDALIGV